MADPVASSDGADIGADDPARAEDALYRRLRRRALRLTGDAAEAEDLTQDAWLRWHRLDRLGAPPANAEAWLTTVQARLALDRYRHRGMARLLAPAIGSQPPARSLQPPVPPDRLELDQAARAALRAAIAGLSPLECLVLLLIDVCELDHREAAALLGRQEAATRQLLSRARRRLREWRERHGPHEPSSGDAHPPTTVSTAASVGTGALVDRCLAAIRSADHRALVAALLQDEARLESRTRIRCTVGPGGRLEVRLGHVRLAIVDLDPDVGPDVGSAEAVRGRDALSFRLSSSRPCAMANAHR